MIISYSSLLYGLAGWFCLDQLFQSLCVASSSPVADKSQMASLTCLAVDRLQNSHRIMAAWLRPPSIWSVKMALDNFTKISEMSPGIAVSTLHVLSHPPVGQSKLLYMTVLGFQQQKGATPCAQIFSKLLFASWFLISDSSKKVTWPSPDSRNEQNGPDRQLTSLIELFAIKEMFHICTIQVVAISCM